MNVMNDFKKRIDDFERILSKKKIRDIEPFKSDLGKLYSLVYHTTYTKNFIETGPKRKREEGKKKELFPIKEEEEKEERQTKKRKIKERFYYDWLIDLVKGTNLVITKEDVYIHLSVVGVSLGRYAGQLVYLERFFYKNKFIVLKPVSLKELIIGVRLNLLSEQRICNSFVKTFYVFNNKNIFLKRGYMTILEDYSTFYFWQPVFKVRKLNYDYFKENYKKFISYFKIVLLQVFYAMYCAHNNFGFTHGDFHLANILIKHFEHNLEGYINNAKKYNPNISYTPAFVMEINKDKVIRILLDLDDPIPIIKIIDFGLSGMIYPNEHYKFKDKKKEEFSIIDRVFKGILNFRKPRLTIFGKEKKGLSGNNWVFYFLRSGINYFSKNIKDYEEQNQIKNGLYDFYIKLKEQINKEDNESDGSYFLDMKFFDGYVIDKKTLYKEMDEFKIYSIGELYSKYKKVNIRRSDHMGIDENFI